MQPENGSDTRTEDQRQEPGERSRRRTMKAIVQEGYGEAPEVLKLAEVERPAIDAGKVLVRVEAAGVDRGAWHLIAGLPYPVRLAFGIRAPRNPVRGLDFAGRVEEVGDKVTTFRPGDRVFGIAEGSFAEYAAARADKVVPMPVGLEPRQAAAVPISGLTALQAIRDRAEVEPGQKVLVIGASGGVGSFAVQIARAHGATVTGVCSSAKVALVSSLGADRVIDYQREPLAGSGGRYDAIIDIGGNTPLPELRRLLEPRGRLVIVGQETSGKWLNGMGRQLRAMVTSPFTGQKLGSFLSSENAADIEVLGDLIDAGEVKPVVDRSFPLEEAAAAVKYLEEGRAAGKVVLVPAPG
jgi:NADPH:quinone reductase-like Zn-dependent oxidoreductase